MCASPRRTFNGFLWVVMVAVMVVMVPPSSATELGSIGHNMDLQNPFADPFHKALNSLPLWMDLSNSSYMDSDASSTKENDTLLRYYLPSPNSTGDVTEQCRWDVQQILNAQNQEALDYLIARDRLWPIYLADSWGKVPDGMLSGNMMPLGMMEECTYLTVKEENEYVNATFNGQYCFVVYGKNGPPIYEQGQGYNRHGYKRQAIQPGRGIIESIPGHIPNLFMGGGSSYGTCMPDSCSPDDFKISLNEVLPDGNEAFWVHCHTLDETQVWVAKDYAFMIVMGLIGFLVVLAAAVDLIINHLGKQELRKGPARYLLVFSGYTNMSKIFHINTKESSTSIACLNGMRVLSMTWVVWGHQFAFTMGCVENSFAIPYYFRDVLGQTILNAQVSVDSFFFLSGLLVGYGLMRNKDKMDLFNFIMFYIHRFIRLAPPIAAMCFFGATVARFFATGPIGELTYLMNMEFCNRNWAHDVFFISNLSQQYCLGQTWYTSVDMQIYVLVPLMFFPIMYYRKFGTVWLMLITLVSCIIPAVISEIYKIPLGMISVPQDKAMDQGFLLYGGTWSRMTPYIVGLWTGYLIYRSNKKPIKMESWQVTLGWVTACIVALLVLYGIYPYNHWNKFYGFDRIPDQLVSDIYTGLFRGAWGLALMWVVIACHSGYGGPVNSFLGHPSWQPLSRLTYGMFLTHIFVIILIVASEFRLKSLNHLSYIVETCGTLFISGIAAVLLSLLVEFPVIGLEKLLLTRTGGERKSEIQKESQNKI